MVISPALTYISSHGLQNFNSFHGCLDYDLTTAKGLELFNTRCKNPWMQPGLTKVASPCGVAGGNPVELNGQPFPYCGGNCGPKCKGDCCQDPGNGTNNCAAGWADGKGAEKYHYPNSPVTEWKRGKRAMVSNVTAYAFQFFEQKRKTTLKLMMNARLNKVMALLRKWDCQ